MYISCIFASFALTWSTSGCDADAVIREAFPIPLEKVKTNSHHVIFSSNRKFVCLAKPADHDFSASSEMNVYIESVQTLSCSDTSLKYIAEKACTGDRDAIKAFAFFTGYDPKMLGGLFTSQRISFLVLGNIHKNLAVDREVEFGRDKHWQKLCRVAFSLFEDFLRALPISTDYLAWMTFAEETSYAYCLLNSFYTSSTPTWENLTERAKTTLEIILDLESKDYCKKYILFLCNSMQKTLTPFQKRLSRIVRPTDEEKKHLSLLMKYLHAVDDVVRDLYTDADLSDLNVAAASKGDFGTTLTRP